MEQPELSVWKGMKLFAGKNASPNFREIVVTKKEYEEEGPRIAKKFYL